MIMRNVRELTTSSPMSAFWGSNNVRERRIIMLDVAFCPLECHYSNQFSMTYRRASLKESRASQYLTTGPEEGQEANIRGRLWRAKPPSAVSFFTRVCAINISGGRQRLSSSLSERQRFFKAKQTYPNIHDRGPERLHRSAGKYRKLQVHFYVHDHAGSPINEEQGTRA